MNFNMCYVLILTPNHIFPQNVIKVKFVECPIWVLELLFLNCGIFEFIDIGTYGQGSTAPKYNI